MKRRGFLKRAALGTSLAGVGLAAPALAQDVRVARLVTAWPRGLTGPGEGAQRLADQITAASDGRIEVKLFAAGELVPGERCFEAVAEGSAEMYHGAEHMWEAGPRALAFFSGLPFGLAADEFAAWIHDGGGQALWDELSAPLGIKPVLAGTSRGRLGAWTRAPIRDAKEIEGLRVAASGVAATVLGALGATVLEVPAQDLGESFRSGEIDAAEGVELGTAVETGLARIVKTVMQPGLQPPSSALSLGINRDWWEDLPTSDQILVAACCDAATARMQAAHARLDAAALRDLVERHGVQVEPAPPGLRARLADAAEAAQAEIARTGETAGRIRASYAGFRALAGPWSRAGTAGYLDARAATLER